MNMNVILEWVKTNVFTVIFIVLMVAALIALPIVSSGMNAKVRKEVENRARKNAELVRLEKGDLTLPDGTPAAPGIVNQRFLNRYGEVAEAMSHDADAVLKAAIEHNSKGRTVLVKEVFPELPEAKRDVLPHQFHNALQDAYQNLLTEVNAGMPPDLEALREELMLHRTQFITQDLRKDTSDKLDAEEQKRLAEELTNVRMSHYASSAEKISLYVSAGQLKIPAWSQEHQPSVGEMFNWQWQLWVTQDILHALHEANKNDPSVTRAPVKQVLGLTIFGLPKVGGDSGSSGQGGLGTEKMGAGSSGGFGDGGAAPSPPAPSEGEAPPPTAAGAINAKTLVPRDFTTSLTGRKTNPLYDVLTVQLDLIVETARLPQVIDTLSKYNFITITELNLSAVDPFAAAQSGYVYGAAPVSNVSLKLETVWLRSWTAPFMPRSIRQALGVGLQAPAAAGADAPPSA